MSRMPILPFVLAGAAGLAALLVAGAARASRTVSSLQRVPTQEEVLQAIRDGRAVFQWRELPQLRGLEVFADALQVDGVRVPVTARTTKAAAELLNASPTTALVEDWIFNEADIRTTPQTQDYRTMMTPKAVGKFNAVLDQQIRKRRELSPSPIPIVSDVGKSWIVDNAALRSPGMAVNYGLHLPDAPYTSIDGRSKLWQTPGTKHEPDHWDYSQTLRLMRYNGGPVPLDRMPAHETLRTDQLWV